MKDIIILNIKELIQVEDSPRLMVKGAEMAELTTIKNAFFAYF